MAQRDRTRRAAGSAGRAGLTAERISTLVLEAAQRRRAGDREAGPRVAGLVTQRCADQPALIEAAVQHTVSPLVAAAWAHGWSPDDLYQLGRRRLAAADVGYLVDAIADESRRYATTTLHYLWRDQLRQIGAGMWWDGAQGHLGQWTRRHRRSPADALGTVIEVVALLIALPALPVIVPPPGAAASSPPETRGIDQKVPARVRGLLAKAESTTFPDEAEALSAKAQELISRHSLERVVAQADAGSPVPAAARRLWLDSPYVAAKGLLVDAVAEANRCRAVLCEQLGFSTVLGEAGDLEMVEVLTTSLLVQATRAMVAAGRRTSSTGQSRTRSFRHSFLIAYATRIRERLSTARDAGTAAVGDPERLLPVLAARERAVDDLLTSMFPASAARSFSVGNAAGWQAGRAAADLAVLQPHPQVQQGGG